MQYYNIKLQYIIAKPASGCVLHYDIAVWYELLSRSYMKIMLPGAYAFTNKVKVSSIDHLLQVHVTCFSHQDSTSEHWMIEAMKVCRL